MLVNWLTGESFIVNKDNPVLRLVKTSKVKRLLCTSPIDTVFGSGELRWYSLAYQMINDKVLALYPALIINENYYSRKLIQPIKFKEIRDRRIELKAKKDPRQKPLKIVIILVTKNSFNSIRGVNLTN